MVAGKLTGCQAVCDRLEWCRGHLHVCPEEQWQGALMHARVGHGKV
jgi:hypothetical protein